MRAWRTDLHIPLPGAPKSLMIHSGFHVLWNSSSMAVGGGSRVCMQGSRMHAQRMHACSSIARMHACIRQATACSRQRHTLTNALLSCQTQSTFLETYRQLEVAHPRGPVYVIGHSMVRR